MSWRDRYQAGSFRGVSFATERHEMSGGRRVELHEFPGRDEPVAEDLGRRARQFSIDCFVVGEDYYDDRDALLDALEAAGPATLIHPWHGTRFVSVLDFSQGEDQAGGYAWFQITFAEAGAAPSLSAAPDARAAARLSAASILRDAPNIFAGRFEVAGVASFVEDAAGDLIGTIAGAAQVAAGLSGGAGGALRAFDTGLRLLGASSLLRSPLALGLTVTGLVAAIGAMTGGPRGRLAALRTMSASVDALDPVPGMTPARDRQRDNQDAIVHLVRSTCAAQMVDAATAISFSSYEDAVATRDSLADLLDGWSLSAADAGDDVAAGIFDTLRLATVRDITARGGTLARVYAHRLGATQPALVIANRLYGAGNDMEARVADLVARNSVRHPGFVPGGVELRVLSDA